MFAQSLVEYGTLSSIGSSLESARYTVQDWLGQLSPTALMFAGAIAIVFLMSRAWR